MALSFNIGTTDIEQGKGMAGISYFGILGFLIAMVTSRDNRFVMYHAQQSLLLSIIFFIRYIPFTPWMLDTVINLVVVVLFIIGLVNGFGGKVQPLPLVGGIAYGFNICKADGE